MHLNDGVSQSDELVPLPLVRFRRIVRQPRGWWPEPGSSGLVDVNPVVKLVSLAVITVVLARATSLIALGITSAALLIVAVLFVRDRPYFMGILLPVTLFALIVAYLKWRFGPQSVESAIGYALFVHATCSLSLITVLTTRSLDIAYALDVVLRPLKWIGVNSRAIVLGVILAVRLFFEAVSLAFGIVKAHRARGKSLRGLNGARLIVFPLIVRLTQSSELLADSLFLRGVLPSNYFSLKTHEFTLRGTVTYAVFIGILFMGLTVFS